MNPVNVGREFRPGFRLSAIDICILIGGAIASAALWLQDTWIGLAVAFVVGHFFLFCNVLRMSRPVELLWAGLFIVSAGGAAFMVISWPVAFGISACATVILAAIEMRRPSYHGAGWRRVNPRLREWWQAKNELARSS